MVLILLRFRTHALLAIFLLAATAISPAYGWEAKYKQKAELWIVNGVVTRNAPHAYVTLDIQDDAVLYKEIEDWKYGTTSRPGGVFQIVSKGQPFQVLSRVDPGWLDTIKDFLGMGEQIKTQNVVRAFYSGGESVNFLIIGETFLLEVKNSVIVGNAVSYMYYERVPD